MTSFDVRWDPDKTRPSPVSPAPYGVRHARYTIRPRIPIPLSPVLLPGKFISGKMAIPYSGVILSPQDEGSGV